MGVLGKSVTAFLLFFFLSAAPSTAEIKSIKIQSDNRPVILFQKFGFTHTSNITVAVSSVFVTSTLSQPDASLLGFFLLSERSLIDVLSELQQNPNFCILDSMFISLLFTFKDLSPPPQSSFNRSYPVTYAELFNTDDKATNNYLSVGLTQLPSLYFIFSLFYLCFLGFWISVGFNNQRSVHKVHILMGVLLIMKVLSLFCAAEDKLYVKVTGMPHGWNVLFYILQFISSVLFFAVIVLIGAGWLYLKPNLVGKEKKVLMIVITLQVLANVASIVIGETGPFIEDWVTWNQVFLLAEFVCGCAAIFPIVWLIRSFSRTDAKAARNLALFRLFCVVVVGYMLVTNIGVFALKTMTVYKQQWVGRAEEIASLVFCLVLFYMFRPVRESEYLVLDDEGVYEEAPKMVKG
ncbi:putative transmembrane protein GPR107/GPR108 [Helianthus annuus]|nr:putative transmembrane protein GPR107/GPR108 [Helianthus annuus]